LWWIFFPTQYLVAALFWHAASFLRAIYIFIFELSFAKVSTL